MSGSMRLFTALVALAVWYFVFAFVGAQQPGPAGPDVCPDCPDPTRPWRRGTTEISCAHPNVVERLRQEHPGVRIDECGHCKHLCDPLNSEAETTGDRAWDYRCSARCHAAQNIPGCDCPSPCSS